MIPVEPGPGSPPTSSASSEAAFWRDGVLSDPELGFCVLDQGGRLLFANNLAGDILLGSPSTALIGLTLDELFVPPIAQERREFLDRVLGSGRAMLVTELWRGVRCRSIWRRLPGGSGARQEVLWTVRRSPAPFPVHDVARLDTLEAQQSDWGPLSVLTLLQRRILGLIGAGFGRDQIAGSLAMSEDDVQLQILAIERALHTTNPVHLARRAFMAGLVQG